MLGSQSLKIAFYQRIIRQCPSFYDVDQHLIARHLIASLVTCMGKFQVVPSLCFKTKLSVKVSDMKTIF